VLFLTVTVVTTVSTRSAHRQVEQDLQLTGRVFQRLMDARVEQLTQGARLLSGDFAFKQAFASDNLGTLLSAVTNLREVRLGADIMMVIDPDTQTVLVDSSRPEANGVTFAYPELLDAVEESGKPASTIARFGGRTYQLIVVPLLAPVPVAWIAVGFLINDELADNIKALTLTDVSFVDDSRGQGTALAASTLPAGARRELAPLITATPHRRDAGFDMTLSGHRYVALDMAFGPALRVVLHRSLDIALAPFERLQHVLALLTVLGLLVCIAGAVLIARSVTRPVRTLVHSTRKISAGDYGHVTAIDRVDEFGELALAFNQMTRALAAFQRYVPVELVRTLISQGMESKPELRTGTIVFVDIEGFTALAESTPPATLVTLLNEYFSAVSTPIEMMGGVITQFQGDAILAVFNIPTEDPDHATHAVRAACEIQRILHSQTFSNDTVMKARIGINTGDVVAGCVGSRNRVNYTVHGDAVNVAARLEALNKETGTRILLSQATAERLDRDIEVRHVDHIAVRGHRRPVSVYEVTVARAVAHPGGVASCV